MENPPPPDHDELPAGDFSVWIDAIQEAFRGEAESDVACGACTACCTSSQFVHIAPDEVATLSRIPHRLRFPAPGLPSGHVLLGYDEQGRCPMLVDGRCSIYEHRPRTCRTYDCRIFPAAGIEPDPTTQGAVARQVRRWRFGHPTPLDRARHESVQAAATYLTEHPEAFPDDSGPSSPMRLAVAAIEAHGAFVTEDGDVVADPGIDEVRIALRRSPLRRPSDPRA